MMSNNLSVKTIGIVFSLCALITVSVIFLCSNLIKQNKLKNFTNFLLLIKSLIILLLFLLNNSGLNILIKFLIMLDYAIDIEIFACIYPMLTLINKSDKLYAIKDLIYNAFYYLGVFLTGLLLGKNIINHNINYNTYYLFSFFITFIAFIVLKRTNLEKYHTNINNNEVNNDILIKLLKKIESDKISHNYLLFTISAEISFYIVAALLITLLTNNLGFKPTDASNLILTLGILSVLLGTIILSKLTTKNDYINLSIKYVGIYIFYLIAVLIPTPLTFLIAIIYLKITRFSYTHIADAPYINRYEGKYQLAFCNLKEMAKYFSRAIGTFLCGLMLSINIRYVFVISSIFALFQIIFSYRALYLRKKEQLKN